MEKALKVAVILSAVDKMSKTVDSAVNNSTKSLTRFSKEASKLGDKAFNLGRQAGMLGLGIGVPLFKAAEAAEESEKATRKLEQVFKSMGETSGKSAKKAQEFASSLMMEIAVDDENIIAVQTKLATFEKVIKNTAGTSEIFERATRAAFDLEAAGFGEGTQNAVQLGKALQDPLHGMIALKKAGTLTAADIERIGTKYKQTGNLLEAQKSILKAVEKQVGGVAKANVSATARIKIGFGEIVEKLGGALLPMLDRFSKWITIALPKIQKWIDDNQDLVSALAAIAATVAAVSLAVSGLSFVFGGLAKTVAFGSTVFATITAAAGLFSGGIGGVAVSFRALDAAMKANVIILIASLIVAAAVAIYYNWDKLKGWFTGLWAKIKQIFWKVVAWIKEWGILFLGPIGFVIKYWDKIKLFFSLLWAKVKELFWKVVAWIKEWGLLFLGPIGFIIKYWDNIKKFFSGLWVKVKLIFSNFIDWIFALPMKFFKAGEAIVNSIWNGMKAKFNDMKNWFKSGLQDLRDMLPFSPAKRGPLKDIHKLKFVETIATNIKPGPMVGAMNKALSAVKGAAAPKGGGTPSLAPAMAGSGGKGGGGFTVNFSPTINMSGGAGGAGAKQDFIAQLKEYQPELMRVINDALARKERAQY